MRSLCCSSCCWCSLARPRPGPRSPCGRLRPRRPRRGGGAAALGRPLPRPALVTGELTHAALPHPLHRRAPSGAARELAGESRRVRDGFVHRARAGLAGRDGDPPGRGSRGVRGAGAARRRASRAGRGARLPGARHHPPGRPRPHARGGRRPRCGTSWRTWRWGSSAARGRAGSRRASRSTSPASASR